MGFNLFDTNMQEDLPDHDGPVGMEQQVKCSEEQISPDQDAPFIVEGPVWHHQLHKSQYRY